MDAGIFNKGTTEDEAQIDCKGKSNGIRPPEA